jgi:hypothetical protein
MMLVCALLGKCTKAKLAPHLTAAQAVHNLQAALLALRNEHEPMQPYISSNFSLTTYSTPTLPKKGSSMHTIARDYKSAPTKQQPAHLSAPKLHPLLNLPTTASHAISPGPALPKITHSSPPGTANIVYQKPASIRQITGIACQYDKDCNEQLHKVIQLFVPNL